MKQIYYLLAIYHYKIFKFLTKQANICNNCADYWYKKYLIKDK